MGRELKRVPLDFNWPLNYKWKGYLNPYSYVECTACRDQKFDSEHELICDLCYGHGSVFCDEKYRKLQDEWERIEPPSGEGYQLWENTSEGTPQSPVFKTLDELCDYAEKNCTTFGSFKATASEWKKMLDENFVHHTVGNSNFKVTFI